MKEWDSSDLETYVAVSKEESFEDVCSESSYSGPPRARVWKSSLTFAFNISLFLVSSMFFYTSVNFRHDARALEQISYYSPLFSRVDIPLISKVVQGTLFNEDSLLLRANPSPAVDEAWDRLAHIGVFFISSSEVRRLGKDPLKTVKAPPSWGYGSDAHLAHSDGQHVLHCLNSVRQYAYREYYFPTQQSCPSNSSGEIRLQPYHQAHLSHCLYLLLQALTCDFSMDVITDNWKETQRYPFPDFEINKKCRDHSVFLEWQNTEKISKEMWEELEWPSEGAGDIVLPLPPKFKVWSEESPVDGSVIGEGAPVGHGHAD